MKSTLNLPATSSSSAQEVTICIKHNAASATKPAIRKGILLVGHNVDHRWQTKHEYFDISPESITSEDLKLKILVKDVAAKAPVLSAERKAILAALLK